MAHASSIFVGSYPAWPTADVTIDGSGETVAASKGGLYLVHETDTTLSLLDQVVAAMTSAGVTAPAAVILRNGKVKLSGTGNWTMTWVDAWLATYLGFDSGANLSGADTYTAPNISPLYWSPGLTDSPETNPLGVDGRPVYDAIAGVAPNGAQVVRVLGSLKEYKVRFGSVLLERQATSANAGGEFFRFFEEVLVKGARMFHYRNVVEDDDDATTAMVLASGQGPMRKRADGTLAPANQRMSGLETVDAYFEQTIHAWQAPEYTA